MAHHVSTDAARTVVVTGAACDGALVYSIVTRADALAMGITRHQLAWLAGTGARWQRVLPGVYATFTGPLTDRHRWIAALKYAGEEAALSRHSAAIVHGLRYTRKTRVVCVAVPVGTRVRSRDWLTVQRTTRPLRRVTVDGITACSVARTVVDLGLILPTLREVRAVVGDVLQRNLTTLDALLDEFLIAPQRGSHHLRCALDDARSGTRSAPEGGLRDLVRDFDLPTPEFNARIVIPGHGTLYADALWRRSRVIAEVDSREWHLSPADWERTMRRHNALQQAGYVVLHFPPSRIYDEPAGVAAEIRSVIGPLGR